MVRAGLSGPAAFKRGAVSGAGLIPAACVVAGSALSALPIVSTTGWWPNFGFVMFIAWRLRRGDPWPIWWAPLLGLLNDLLTGAPLGLSIALWSGVALAMELVDHRTQWRDYWVEWAIATVLLAADRAADWQVAAWAGAPVPFLRIIPAIAISVLAFPVAAMLVLRADRWRWGQ